MADVIAFKPKRLPVSPPGQAVREASPLVQSDIAAALATGFRSMNEARDFALAMGILDALESFAHETLQMVEVFRKSVKT